MDIRAILMGLAFAFMWSSAFTSARIIVAHAPPMSSLAVRFVISGLVGIAIARAMGQSWHLSRRQWLATALFGICQNALYLGLNFVAMQTVEASLASIIASTMPLIVALMGWIAFRERLGPMATLGLLAGFAGVGLIMGARLGGGVDLFGVGLCIVGATALALATLTLRGTSSGGNFLMIVGLQMLVGAVPLGILAILTEDFVITWSIPFVVAFTYTVFIPGLTATLVWFLLVNRIGAIRAATFHFLNPFFGVAVAAVFLGETLTVQDGIGVAVITVGILLVQRSRVADNRGKPTINR